MKIKARTAVQLGGHIYAKGETAEYSGPIDRRICDNFTSEDGCALYPDLAPVSSGKTPSNADEGSKDETSKVEKTVSTLKRQGICQALDSMNVTYSPKSSTTYLARLLLSQRGEIES